MHTIRTYKIRSPKTSMLETELQALPFCTSSDIAMYRNGSVSSKFRSQSGLTFSGYNSAV